MKKQKVIIVLVIALLLLVIGSFGIYKFADLQKNKEPERVEILSCMSSAIVKYGVTNGKESYTLVKKDGEWVVADNEVAVLDQKMVQEIVNSASHIVSQGILKEKALKEFSATDVKTLEIRLENGMEYRVDFVGEKGESCAAKLNEGEDIYLLKKSVRDILIANLDKLRVSLVFEELRGTDEVLTSYSFVDYDKSRTVIRTKNAAEIAKNKDNRYIMDIPYKKDVDDETFEQQILVRIPAVAAAKYVDDFPENLADYGLDEQSRAVLSFRWGDKNETLYLGTEEAGKIHAVKEGKDGVFVINASQLEFLQTDPFFLLETGILATAPENVVSIGVEYGNEYFSVSRSKDNSTFFVNNKTASRKAFDDVVEKLGDIEISGEIIDVPQNTNDVRLSISFDNGTGAQNIALSKLSNNKYALFANGKTEFTVDSECVDEFLEELQGVAKNPMKTDEKG